MVIRRNNCVMNVDSNSAAVKRRSPDLEAEFDWKLRKEGEFIKWVVFCGSRDEGGESWD